MGEDITNNLHTNNKVTISHLQISILMAPNPRKTHILNQRKITIVREIDNPAAVKALESRIRTLFRMKM